VKAVCIHEFGGLEKLSVEEVPDPEPQAGYVRLRVAAAALNHVDVDIRDGVSRFDVKMPHILGLELVGTVDKLGEGVADWKAGDRVMPYLLGFTDYFIGVGGPGGFAEYCVAPAQQLVRIPDEIGFDDAAALQVAFGTAWHMLYGRARLAIGESVLITSVSAGIASAAVQLAKLGGAYVIGSSSSQEKLDRATALGMDAGINYTTEDVPARVRELTGGKGVDVVFEHVGGAQFQNGLDSLCFDGRLVTCGGHGGEVVPFDIIPFFRSQHQVIGSFVYSREELEKVLSLGARGMIKPLIAKTFALDEAPAAMSLLERREFFGKILLKP